MPIFLCVPTLDSAYSILKYFWLFLFIDLLAKFVMTREAHQLTWWAIAQLAGTLIDPATATAPSLAPAPAPAL